MSNAGDNVVSLAEHRNTVIVKPKIERRTHNGHRYILRFDPNAPPHIRWIWMVQYTRTYEYVGACDDIEKAARQAERKIRELIGKDDKRTTG